MADKVYCVNCIFYDAGENVPYSFGPPEHQQELCLSPNNFKDTYANPSSLPISQPKIINRFNNCVWFSPITDNSSSSSSSSS